MTIKQCWEWAVFDQLLNVPSGSVSADSAIRMATFAMRLLQAESSPGICERLCPSGQGEDHELLMDDVIADMTGVGKTRNIRPHIRPGFAERWGLCKPLYRPTKFGQIPLRLGGAPLAYGESTNVEQIRLIVRR